MHPLLKKILDPPLSSRFNKTVGNDGDHCHKNHLWFNLVECLVKIIRHCTKNGNHLQIWISSSSYTKFGIEIDQWQKRGVTWEVRKVQMVLNFPTVALLNTWMVLVYLQKKWGSYVFKTLWLDNLLPSTLVQVAALLIGNNLVSVTLIKCCHYSVTLLSQLVPKDHKWIFLFILREFTGRFA